MEKRLVVCVLQLLVRGVYSDWWEWRQQGNTARGEGGFTSLLLAMHTLYF